MKTEKRKIGDIGENVACRFLMKRGFTIVERNYLRKWGEIDIVARKEQKLYFVEVKSVSRPHQNAFGQAHETDQYRPEDNIHPWKLKRLSRAIQTYLLAHCSTFAKASADKETDWQFDVIVVYLNLKNMTAKINYMEDITL